jgi:hypothetical protein
MSALRFAFSFFCCVFLAGQLSFISGHAYAAEKKPAKPKVKIAKSDAGGPKPCCMPGAPCPTPATDGSTGCKCCGFRVDGKLVEYNGLKRDSTLELLEEHSGTAVPVTFVVTSETVDQKLKTMGNGTNGHFVLKTKKFDNSPSPSGFGYRVECIDTGDTSIENRTQQFLQGSEIAGEVFEVIEALLNAVPKYAPELAEDK